MTGWRVAIHETACRRNHCSGSSGVDGAHAAMAQTRTVKAEMRTETATVEAIDANTRTMSIEPGK
jgi:hypothetical protein